MAHLVLTLIGPDRPGLVEALAEPIAAHGGNWLASRMARLGGEFAGILSLEVPDTRASDLVKTLSRLDGLGLKIVAERTEPEPEVPHSRLLVLDVVGLDRPGIVREISHALHAFGVNIEELATDRTTAPMSGELLFRSHATLRVPARTDPGQVRSSLERLASDLMVQVKLEDAP
ncbi:MAG TPA: ACT domain-containing protein [Anaeromyxobacteraceae bacterium]|nr:ACT domain-containing protein [Anaeromyxobacteraceae bacterium]